MKVSLNNGTPIDLDDMIAKLDAKNGQSVLVNTDILAYLVRMIRHFTHDIPNEPFCPKCGFEYPVRRAKPEILCDDALREELKCQPF